MPLRPWDRFGQKLDASSSASSGRSALWAITIGLGTPCAQDMQIDRPKRAKTTENSSVQSAMQRESSGDLVLQLGDYKRLR